MQFGGIQMPREVLVGDTLLAVHGFVRYLVLLTGLVAAMVSLVVWLRATTGPDRPLLSAFTGLIDLQVLLGLVLLTQRPFYGALMGHIVTMVGAAVVAHMGSVLARKRADVKAAALVRFMAAVAALALIFGGVMAIGRTII